MNPRIVAVLAVVVFGVVASAIWFLQSKPSLTPVVVPSTPAPISTTTVLPDASLGSADSTPVSQPSREVEAKAPTNPAQPLAEWEVRIDQVLSQNMDELATAKTLISLLPTMPTEGQVEATNHITNLIADKDYGLVLPMLKNAQLSSDVQDVLVTDLMNREDPVKLPALLDVARIPNHPYHEEALTDLQIFLDGDYGNDFQKWNEALQKYLRTQAADEAAANAEPAAR